MHRYTMKELEGITVRNFILLLISDRRESLTNAYSPLSERLIDLERYVDKNIPNEKLPGRWTG